MASVTTTTAYKPTLTRPSDWPAWYNSLKKVANDRELLDTVDINNNDWLPLIKQMQSWRSFESERREKKSYEREIDLVREVKEWIRTNTAATYMNLAESDRATLKDIVCSQEARKVVVTRQVALAVAGTYNANWMNTVVMKSAEAELKGSEQDLPYYANAFRLVCEVEPSRSNSAFSTFNGKPEGDRPTYTCPCRPDAAFHKPEKEEGQAPDLAEKARLCPGAVEEALVERPGREDQERHHRREERLVKTATMITMINALNYGPHPLSRSVIFDTGASIHVVNSKAMLVPGTFTPSTGDDSVQVGDSHLAIDGRGTWVIKKILNGPEGKNTLDLTLSNVAVITGFHVNIVSSVILKRKADMWYHGFDNTVRFGPSERNKVITSLIVMYDLLVIQYNDISSCFTVLKSSLPKNFASWLTHKYFTNRSHNERRLLRIPAFTGSTAVILLGLKLVFGLELELFVKLKDQHVEALKKMLREAGAHGKPASLPKPFCSWDFSLSSRTRSEVGDEMHTAQENQRRRVRRAIEFYMATKDTKIGSSEGNGWLVMDEPALEEEGSKGPATSGVSKSFLPRCASYH
ncbi:hypothetical protein B0T26DRAFT_806186 [Lasiosphaeria miniovina]|uniref:Polyprotein n=1 Tax=Lasiosphaeria miniovina TaxID=1954250 RepID=A0AA39ZZS6_9PEZI|nr:uncharacterized protein B0T26DRAFT_806186 [Lasiosphaeria miniovina]KAK0706404.1 hypothetical protein B0T26DRAFT_806186 [Lasiosphaeria miniovina]